MDLTIPACKSVTERVKIGVLLTKLSADNQGIDRWLMLYVSIAAALRKVHPKGGEQEMEGVEGFGGLQEGEG